MLARSLPALASGTNAGADREPGEPLHANQSGGASVWYSWTAGETQRVVLTVCGTVDVQQITVYGDYAIEPSDIVTETGASCDGAPLRFTALAGKTYLIAVQGSDAPFELTIPPVARNDDFTHAQPVGAGSTNSTNVDSTIKALESFTEPVVLIAGGKGKGQDFAPLAEAARGRVRRAVLIGQDGGQIRAALEGVGIPTESADSMEDAVRRSRDAERVGDVVLLSPACASFDMFRNFEHRGDVFKSVVRALLG